VDYLLRLHVIDRVPEIPIDAARADRLKAARETLVAALAIEEHYEIVLGMYKSLEKAAFNIAIEEMTHKGLPDYDELFDLRVPLNVGVISLLTAVRLYLDTLKRHVRSCLPESTTVEEDVKKLCSSEYDTHLDYRFMEQLRNHVQHHGLPVHNFSLGSRWDEKRTSREHYVSFFATKATLSRDPQFKRKVLDELPDSIDLQGATRRYIDCLSRINVGVRALTEFAVGAARAELQSTLEEYRAAYGKDVIALHVFQREGDRLTALMPVLLKWDDSRIRLQKKNPFATNLRPAHITNKVHESKQEKRLTARQE
jgi:hypothetical protein